jgi:hypothetical protein
MRRSPHSVTLRDGSSGSGCTTPTPHRRIMNACPALKSPSVAMSFARRDALRSNDSTRKVRTPSSTPATRPAVTATGVATVSRRS